MKKAGFSEFTAPAELNESELKILGLETAELTVYGLSLIHILPTNAQIAAYVQKNVLERS